MTDADVFEVSSFQLIAGLKPTALSDPLSVVLTETTAKKYFGHTNVVGEQLYVVSDWSPEEKVYQVTGIMKDLPGNTHLPLDMLFLSLIRRGSLSGVKRERMDRRRSIIIPLTSRASTMNLLTLTTYQSKWKKLYRHR